VIEAVVDPDGCWLPSTPVISVHAPIDVLWLVGAVLLAPPVTEVGQVMNDAYGAGDDVLAWWSARLAPARDRV
jgi:hypothetical protein